MSFFWNALLPNPVDPGEDESPHYPFKRRARLGPGPMKETNRRAQLWDCQCENYVCVCVGIAEETAGRRRVIRTDPKAKAKYNKMYRQWRKQQAKRKKRR